MNGIIAAVITTLALGGTTAMPFPDTSDFRMSDERAAELDAERVKYLTDPAVIGYNVELGSCTTYYKTNAGNANRNFNMELAGAAINGVVLAPGEEFSYNDTILSKRDRNNDYKPAGVISGGKLINATGGGICQVSSTLFNAALLSGMTITQRQSHSMRVGYLPAGMDATASWGSIDFRFRNDLEVPVQINAKVADGVMTIKLFAPVDPELGKIEVNVTRNGGQYRIHRYVNGVEDYASNSRYR